MRSLFIVLATSWSCLTALSIPADKESSNSTLKLVHVVFRHGNRNPDQDSIVVGSSHYNESYYPEGYGQLTNAGKLTEFKIGEELRKRYDDFLTETWNIKYLDVRTTNLNRTKMSVELMLASLYPPQGNQIWSLLNWQPIPYNYLPESEDKETQGWNACNTKWKSLLSEIISSPKIADYLLRYEELFATLSNKTGEPIGIFDVFFYYFGFATQVEVGYTLEEWTKSFYPEPIHSAAVDFYYIVTNTTSIRRIMAGYLLKKILTDTKFKINETLSPPERKMFVYSGHELNVGSMVLSLDAFAVTDIPPYGSYVLFEIHEIENVWGIKLFYQNYEETEPIPIKLLGCDYFCPYDDFYSFVEEILPIDDTDCDGS